MKSKKNILVISAASLVILATSVTAFATTSNTTAGVIAEITGRTVESIVAEKNETGKTYGSIAADAEKLDEFKAMSLEAKKENLYAQVAEGTITQEKADDIIKALEEAQANCDGTQSQAIGKNTGANFGSNGTGLGTGCANGGTGKGKNCAGMGGKGLQDGSCYTVE